MKKTLLTCAIALVGMASYGQIATYVLQPASVAGPLEFNMADDWGMLPDMSIPANRVQAMAVIVDDGTAADSLGCNPLVNGVDVAGKIAIVYRGSCQFGTKAYNAQQAGAVGVVIVNNAPGAPVGMAAGDDGPNVSVPVVMISQAGGALIHDEVVAGNVEMLIGSVQDMFPDNLSMKNARTLVPTMAARPALVSTADDNYMVQLGAWVYNFGSAAQSNVTLNATITSGGNPVYNETSSPNTINPGDSVFIALPDFNQSSGYSGRYELAYTADLGAADQFPDDNTYTTSASFDSLLSYSPLDGTGLPEQIAFFRPSDPFQSYGICAYFSSPHASRLRADGIYAAALRGSSANIAGQVLNAGIFEAEGTFTQSGIDITAASEIMTGEFAYTDSLQAGEVVYIPFFEETVLEDNKNYLFCVASSDATVYLGHTNSLNYDETGIQTDQVSTFLHLDDTWSSGWNTGEVPALGVKMSSASVGINENNVVELTPYPNPTNSMISIPMAGQTGKATVQVMDTKGAKVLDRQVSVGGNNILSMDLGNLKSGLYTFHVTFESGARSSFRVSLTK